MQLASRNVHELEADAELRGQPMREVDVEPDELTARVDEGERQRVGEVADAERSARMDRLECRRARRSGLGVRGGKAHGLHRLRQHLVLPVGRVQDRLEERSRTPQHREGGDDGGHDVPEDASRPPGEDAGHGTRDEQCDRHRVDRSKQRSESRVDHAGGEEQLERVGGDAEQVEQERDGRVETAEERDDAGECEARVFRDGNEGIGEIRHHSRRLCDRLADDLQDVEEHCLALDANERDAEQDGEEHHRRHHVIGE